MEHNQLLVALDGSAVAEATVPFAEAFARYTGACCCLLRVIPALPQTSVDPLGTTGAAWARDEQQVAEQYLLQTAAGIQARGGQACTETRTGSPAESILQTAAERDVALLLLASHGQGGVKHWLLGSTATRVLCQSCRPTLLIPALAGPNLAPAPAFQQLLVPLDGSPNAEAALGVAVELTALTGATLTLVAVAAEREAIAAAGAYLDGVRAGLPEWLAIEPRVVQGSVAPTSKDYASHHGVDLVIMSTDGYRPRLQTVLGSTVDRMVRSGIPTLLVSPDAPARHLAGEAAFATARGVAEHGGGGG